MPPKQNILRKIWHAIIFHYMKAISANFFFFLKEKDIYKKFI